MAYVLNWSSSSLKPVITLQDGSIDTTSTSLTLISRSAPNWGEPLQEDLMKLLENFANSTPPSSPTYGQLWYDTSASPGILKAYALTNEWVKIVFSGSEVGTTAGPTPPVPGTEGRLWYDTSTTPGILKVYHNNAWIPVIDPSLLEIPVQPTAPAGLMGHLWFDTSVNNGTLKIYNGTAWVEAAKTMVPVQVTPPDYTLDGRMWYDTTAADQGLKIRVNNNWRHVTNKVKSSTGRSAAVYHCQYRGVFNNFTHNLSLVNQHFSDIYLPTSTYAHVANVTGSTVVTKPDGTLTQTPVTNIGVVNIDITPEVDSYVSIYGYHGGLTIPAFRSGQIIFYIDILIDGVRISGGSDPLSTRASSSLWTYPTPGIGSYENYFPTENYVKDHESFFGMISPDNSPGQAVWRAGVKKTLTIKWMPGSTAAYNLTVGYFTATCNIFVQPV